MKYSVASFFLLISLLPVVAPNETKGQEVKRSSSRREALQNSKSRNGPPDASPGRPIRICQGVAIPDGYVVVAYETSSVCPHGAYLLRKDDSPSRFFVGATRGAPNSPPATAATVSRPRRVGNEKVDSLVPQSTGAPVYSNSSEPTLSGTLLGTGDSVSAKDPRSSSLERTTEEEVGEGDVVRIDTNLVTVPVSVLDRQGRYVPDLRREDFSVFENGVQQQIAYFEPTEKPFTVALLLDTSGSTIFHLSEIKDAAIAFAKQLRPQDRVLIVTFNEQVMLLTEATNNLDTVTEVVRQYAQTGFSTRLYDAIDLIINERLNKIQGRKAIVLFTDGVDTASYLATYQSTLREVEELDALIYPIQYDTSDFIAATQNTGNITIVTTRSSNWPFPSSSSSRVIYGPPRQSGRGSSKAEYERADQYLHQLADKSGARLYKANDPERLAEAFSRIAEELRRQYSLGYYPQTSAQAGERRAIKVRVNQSDLAVRARASYMQRAPAKTTQ